MIYRYIMSAMDFRYWLNLHEAEISSKTVTDITTHLNFYGRAPVVLVRPGVIVGPSSNVRLGKGFTKAVLTKDHRGTEKQVRIEVYGNLLTPQAIDLIKTLKDSGVIDDSWVIKPRAKLSEFIGTDQVDFNGGFGGETVGKMIEKPPLDRNVPAENLVFWHGTSSKDWEDIQRSGVLKPLYQGSQEAGFQSRGKNTHNKDHVYLAANEDVAWTYAKDRASHMNEKYFKDEWIRNIRWEHVDRWPIKPVLLKVKIPDTKNLRSDDDPVSDFLRKIGDKVWERKSPEEKQNIAQYIAKKYKTDPKNEKDVKVRWRDDEIGMSELINKLPARVYNTWLASMYRQKQVAYKGSIPLKYIEEVPFVSRGVVEKYEF